MFYTKVDMMTRNSTGTLWIVEPSFTGHHLAYVRYVAVHAPVEDIRLLTCKGIRDTPEYRVHLSGVPLTILECFDSTRPPTQDVANAVRVQLRDRTGPDHVVVLESDPHLWTWWMVAAGLARGDVRVTLLLMRYGPVVGARARMRRSLKSVAVLLARLTVSTSRVLALGGISAGSRFLGVRTVRDPASCRWSVQDRVHLREGLGWPANRAVVGIFGAISGRKSVALVASALASPDTGNGKVCLLIAGPADSSAEADIATARSVLGIDRLLTVLRPLDESELDGMIAAVDVVVVAHANEGPSGIFLKAAAAGVPIVAAGSRTLRMDAAVVPNATHVDLQRAALRVAILNALNRPDSIRGRTRLLPTPAEFARDMSRT